MNAINSFIVSFCGGCILLGFLYMLCPSGNMSAPVKYIFCLCFVCLITATVISLPKPDFSNFDSDDERQVLTEQNTAVTAQLIFSEALRKQNINFRKIEVDTNKLGDNSITISKVTVYTNHPAQDIIQILDPDGYEVVVINE